MAGSGGRSLGDWTRSPRMTEASSSSELSKTRRVRFRSGGRVFRGGRVNEVDEKMDDEGRAASAAANEVEEEAGGERDAAAGLAGVEFEVAVEGINFAETRSAERV